MLSFYVVCESLVALLLSIMAKIIGVEASSWHGLVKGWWQFVRFPMWSRKNTPLNSIQVLVGFILVSVVLGSTFLLYLVFKDLHKRYLVGASSWLDIEC